MNTCLVSSIPDQKFHELPTVRAANSTINMNASNNFETEIRIAYAFKLIFGLAVHSCSVYIPLVTAS